MVKERDRGSELIQAIIGFPFLIMLVFGVVQIGGMALMTNRLASDITRAQEQIDVNGLVLAQDKDTFLRSEILRASGQLDEESLHVTNGSVSVTEKSETNSASQSSTVDETQQVAHVSYDVVYDMPSIINIPSLMGHELRRHIDFDHVVSRRIEVSG